MRHNARKVAENKVEDDPFMPSRYISWVVGGSKIGTYVEREWGHVLDAGMLERIRVVYSLLKDGN